MSSWKLEPFQVFMRLLAIVKPEVVVGKCSHLEAIQRARWFACPVMQLCKWKWTVNHSLPSLGLEPSDHPLSFWLELTLPGLQLQFVLHRDQENSQRRSLKGTKRRCQATTRVTNGFVLLQCCQGAHITIVLRIPRPQFIAITHLPSVPIERRGIYSKHTQFLLFIGNNPPSCWQVEEIKALWRPHDLKLARETYESFLVVVYDSRLSFNVTTGHFA